MVEQQVEQVEHLILEEHEQLILEVEEEVQVLLIQVVLMLEQEALVVQE